MKKSILIAMLAALMSQNIFAQQNPQGVKKQKQDKQERVNKEGRQRWSAEKMVQMQTARLTNELMLDDANAAKFKDIYQSYQKDLQTVRQKYHPKREQAQKPAEGEKPQMKERKQITDQDIEERILNQMKEQKEMLSVKESYYAKFRKVLSPKQIQKVYAQGNRGGFGQRNFGGNRRMQIGRRGPQNRQMGAMPGKRMMRRIHGPQGQTQQRPQAPQPIQES